MNRLKVERWVILLATFVAGVFALQNLIDEMYQNLGYLDVFDYWVVWNFFPVINLLIGCYAKNPSRVRTCTVLAVLFAYFYSLYAFNGSTREKLGAEHMHVDFVPIISAPLFLLVHFLGSVVPPLRRLINRPFQGT